MKGEGFNPPHLCGNMLKMNREGSSLCGNVLKMNEEGLNPPCLCENASKMKGRGVMYMPRYHRKAGQRGTSERSRESGTRGTEGLASARRLRPQILRLGNPI